MQGKPLSSGQQTGMLIFILMMLPAIGFLGGIIPALLMVWGVAMAKRNQDFSYIHNIMIVVRWYLYLLAIGVAVTLACLLVYELGYESLYETISYYGFAEVIGLSLTPLIPLFALALVRIMFYEPLLEHRDWVIKHGIFSNEYSVQHGNMSVGQRLISRIFHRKSLPAQSLSPAKSATNTSHTEASLVDELERWVRLRDANAISEEEYHQAKEALMLRMKHT